MYFYINGSQNVEFKINAVRSRGDDGEWSRDGGGECKETRPCQTLGISMFDIFIKLAILCGPGVRTWAFNAGGAVQSLVMELGSHMPCGQNIET